MARTGTDAEKLRTTIHSTNATLWLILGVLAGSLGSDDSSRFIAVVAFVFGLSAKCVIGLIYMMDSSKK